jgi:hypothetical protein
LARIRLPSHKNTHGLHLGVARAMVNSSMCLHERFRRRPRHGAKRGGWPASGGGASGSGETKGRRGDVSSPHVLASAGERAAGETTTVKIDAGGRSLRTAATLSVGVARDLAKLN